MPVPVFDPAFRQTLAQLLEWRRDVRHFRADPVDSALIDRLLRQAMRAPSVGLSQPWRWVLVRNADRRQAVRNNFAAANSAASELYEGERNLRYGSLKLAGQCNTISAYLLGGN